jgi:hypothetical protein
MLVDSAMDTSGFSVQGSVSPGWACAACKSDQDIAKCEDHNIGSSKHRQVRRSQTLDLYRVLAYPGESSVDHARLEAGTEKDGSAKTAAATTEERQLVSHTVHGTKTEQHVLANLKIRYCTE